MVVCEPLSKDLEQNISHIRSKLGNSSDLVVRKIRIGKEHPIHAAVFYTDGLTDTKAVQNFILESLMLDIRGADIDETLRSGGNLFQTLQDRFLTAGEVNETGDYANLLQCLVSGSVILLLDQYATGISIGSMREWKERGVTESSTETVIRGPKESFTESLRINTSLMRRKIKDPGLWLETRSIGAVTHTDVALMFVKGIVNEDILREVRDRLDRIEIDGILESGYIEELIEDETFTPFPTIYHSERPDVIAAELLEGKIAIMIDGTPMVMVAPSLFVSFMHSAEDYYQRAMIASLIRMLRYICICIALLAPSLYIAITTFHQEMLPTQLLIGLAAQREGVPFPAFIEAFFMEVTFEILREAGLRMPKAIAQTVSIVGTLVIGTAAVEAGIISAAMVIVVSITAISSFVLPAFDLSLSFRMLRFPLMILAATFGLFGIIVGIIAIVLHMCSLRSFGVPYMSPFAPFNLEGNRDTVVRMPLWSMVTRPRLIAKANRVRGRNRAPQPPKPPQNESKG
ncbi:spore germination protein [Paenibacillus sp. PAMC21692]|uniref:spore germination protein n=1 Tax=Paenibacillus sp. PAMC21692 TaxID=2762320 RepID=UPI00164E0A75|nr:spore germination protein [Paenibacillus sp. PAMC21692]QNK57304.1 spore germination protein [Paenibacillus sp. PAMC21692]